MSPLRDLIYVSSVGNTLFSHLINWSNRSQPDEIRFRIERTIVLDSHRADSFQGTKEKFLVRRFDPVFAQEHSTCPASTRGDEHGACRTAGIKRKVHMLKAMP